MVNVVLKVQENFNPKDNDILVYNHSKGCWELVTKVAYLNGVNSQIKALVKENEALKNEIKGVKNDISILAKIIKEKM